MTGQPEESMSECEQLERSIAALEVQRAALGDAVVGSAISRLRPVLLTTVTTIGGLSPLFLNLSGGAEFWGPLTGAVIFGLAFATVLTLVVIPVCYSLAYNWADRKAHT